MRPFLIAEFADFASPDVHGTIASLFTTCPNTPGLCAKRWKGWNQSGFADGKPVRPSGSWKAQKKLDRTRRKLASRDNVCRKSPALPTQPSPTLPAQSFLPNPAPGGDAPPGGKPLGFIRHRTGRAGAGGQPPGPRVSDDGPGLGRHEQRHGQAVPASTPASSTASTLCRRVRATAATPVRGQPYGRWSS